MIIGQENMKKNFIGIDVSKRVERGPVGPVLPVSPVRPGGNMLIVYVSILFISVSCVVPDGGV